VSLEERVTELEEIVGELLIAQNAEIVDEPSSLEQQHQAFVERIRERRKKS